MNVGVLRKLPLFEGLSETDLEWLAAQAQQVSVRAGEFLIREGDPGDSAYVVIEGEFEIIKRSDQRDIVIALREPGAVIGEMALLDRAPRSASVRSVTESRLLQISDAVFYELIERSTPAVKAILKTVSGRLQQNEGMLRQSEKMAALGTLSAGLAHELNNPAAAVHRSAQHLRQKLQEWHSDIRELGSLELTSEQSQRLEALRQEVSNPRNETPGLDPLLQSAREEEVQSGLEAVGIEDGWALAPVLVALGWGTERLHELQVQFSPPQIPGVIRWLANSASVFSLLNEISMASERVSEIVRSVKEYSYLDQGPVQQVDIQRGLENTLVILRHKISEGTHIDRQYDPALPMIEAYGSELNQVWTNLLDNALDATGGRGHLLIRTRTEPGRVFVDIQDDGPGIPPEIQKRIFEPFFTTKPPGIGTGLGLHIAYTIVHKHYGQITVSSSPGRTLFTVKLPVALPRAEG